VNKYSLSSSPQGYVFSPTATISLLGTRRNNGEMGRNANKGERVVSVVNNGTPYVNNYKKVGK
jgi:hypothetical protein